MYVCVCVHTRKYVHITPFQVSSLVGERAAGLVLSLRNMGMSSTAYWVSWALTDATMALLAAALLVGFGASLQRQQ